MERRAKALPRSVSMDIGSASSKNYYELLGVSQTASTQEIRETYRELARVYHPDSNYYSDILPEKVSPEQIELFKIITAAYQTLIDPAKRKEYDTLLRPAVSEKVKLWEDNHDDFWDKQVSFGARSGPAPKRARAPTFGQTGPRNYQANLRPGPRQATQEAVEESVNEAILQQGKQRTRRVLIAVIGLAVGAIVAMGIIHLSKPGRSYQPQVSQPAAQQQNPASWRKSLDE